MLQQGVPSSPWSSPVPLPSQLHHLLLSLVHMFTLQVGTAWCLEGLE